MANDSGWFDSPVYLAVTCGVAGVVTAACLLLGEGIHGRRHAVEWIPLAAVFGVAMFLTYFAAGRLGSGVREARWTGAALDPIRRVVWHPAWTAATVLLLVCMALSMILSNLRHFSLYMCCFWLNLTATQLSGAVRKPSTSRDSSFASGEMLDWRKSAPLQSEHWGSR